MDILANEKFKNYMKRSYLGFLVIFIYFFTSSIEVDILKFLGVDYNTMPLTLKVIYAIALETVIICLVMLVLNKKISKDFKDMLTNHKKYFKKYFKFYLIALGIMIMSNLFINVFVTKGMASNEETLRDTFQISPIYIFYSSVIFAPLVEELVFRQGIRYIINNKVIFILVSGLIFGGLHIIAGYKDITDLLYLIPYCAPGIAFAYMLADSDNIFVSIAIHCMHNGILIALQFLLLIFS